MKCVKGPAACTVWLAEHLPVFVKNSRSLAPSDIGKLLEGLGKGAANETLYRKGAESVCVALGLSVGKWRKSLSGTALPVVAFLPNIGCVVIYGQTHDGAWMLEGPLGRGSVKQFPDGSLFLPSAAARDQSSRTSVMSMFRATLAAHWGLLVWAVLASVFANLLALGASLYSMQVYDRVVPTQAVATLWVLTVGVLIAAALEFAIRVCRAALLDRALRQIDVELSFHIFARILKIRLDQFPGSVGTLSSKVRSYESIKSFASSALLFGLIDLPFAGLFLLVVMALSGWAALVPVVFAVVSLTVGMLMRVRVEQMARAGAGVSNRKLGLLVESVANAELIKAAGHGWRQQANWSRLCRESIQEDKRLRGMTDFATQFAALMQQVGYVTLLATGAYLATSENLSTGSIVACSILSGRILAPVGVLPGLMLQWGHARAAMENLTDVFKLEEDNHGVAQPLVPQRLRGQFALSKVRFAYRGRPESLNVSDLRIKPGEKVGIVGTNGVGKSTLLKVLAGLYQPQQGSVLLDGHDMRHICRAQLSERIGYLSQDVRLLSGTLRDNLVLGAVSVSDAEILAACEKTGLIGLVSSHDKGLDLEISEGGSGVSGGQRQLIALTRQLLVKPDIYLMDEPTAAMDEWAERMVINALKSELTSEKTLVLVTHKMALLGLVDRLIILGPNGIVLDGSCDEILNRLRARQPSAARPSNPCERRAA